MLCVVCRRWLVCCLLFIAVDFVVGVGCLRFVVSCLLFGVVVLLVLMGVVGLFGVVVYNLVNVVRCCWWLCLLLLLFVVVDRCCWSCMLFVNC